ncbi:hypothetical protein CSB37_02935 [bacterium DOLZORAL124_38_8]|nr:MAG: hypothetical protein CSB37_02935 [bacterium DOLZORAL124_38_8]
MQSNFNAITEIIADNSKNLKDGQFLIVSGRVVQGKKNNWVYLIAYNPEIGFVTLQVHQAYQNQIDDKNMTIQLTMSQIVNLREHDGVLYKNAWIMPSKK